MATGMSCRGQDKDRPGPMSLPGLPEGHGAPGMALRFWTPCLAVLRGGLASVLDVHGSGSCAVRGLCVSCSGVGTGSGLSREAVVREYQQ